MLDTDGAAASAIDDGHVLGQRRTGEFQFEDGRIEAAEEIPAKVEHPLDAHAIRCQILLFFFVSKIILKNVYCNEINMAMVLECDGGKWQYESARLKKNKPIKYKYVQ